MRLFLNIILILLAIVASVIHLPIFLFFPNIRHLVIRECLQIDKPEDFGVLMGNRQGRSMRVVLRCDQGYNNGDSASMKNEPSMAGSEFLEQL